MEKSDKVTDDERVCASDDMTRLADDLVIDPQSEKKLLRKLDIWIAPVMTIIFLTAYLDRANIGNAASAGMTEDINMSSGELGSRPPKPSVPSTFTNATQTPLPCSMLHMLPPKSLALLF